MPRDAIIYIPPKARRMLESIRPLPRAVLGRFGGFQIHSDPFALSNALTRSDSFDASLFVRRSPTQLYLSPDAYDPMPRKLPMAQRRIYKTKRSAGMLRKMTRAL
jgi:hypothetical protein